MFLQGRKDIFEITLCKDLDMISRNTQSLSTATDLPVSFLRRDIDEFFLYPVSELESES